MNDNESDTFISHAEESDVDIEEYEAPTNNDDLAESNTSDEEFNPADEESSSEEVVSDIASSRRRRGCSQASDSSDNSDICDDGFENQLSPMTPSSEDERLTPPQLVVAGSNVIGESSRRSPSRLENTLPSEEAFVRSPVKLHVRPPQLKLPKSAHDLPLPRKLLMVALQIYETLRRFNQLVRLSPFTFEDFCTVLETHQPTVLLAETFIALIRSVLRQTERNNIIFGLPEQRDSINILWYCLDTATWSDVLRQLMESFSLDRHFDKARLACKFVDTFAIIRRGRLDQAAERLECLKVLSDLFVDSSVVRDEMYICENATPRIRYDDHCRSCHKLGDLLCCETCSAVYHLECIEPPMAAIPEDEWMCSVCLVHQVTGVADCVSPEERSGFYPRHEMIGNDRHGRRYWFIARRLIVEDLRADTMRYYSSIEQVDLVIAALSRQWEPRLLRRLSARRPEIERQMTVTSEMTEEACEGQPSVLKFERDAAYTLVIATQNIVCDDTTHNGLSNELLSRNNPLENDRWYLDSGDEDGLQVDDVTWIDRSETSELEPRRMFRLGQEENFRLYENQYSINRLALNKHQLGEERDRKRLLANKFSLTHQAEFKYDGDIMGSAAGVAQMLRATIVFMESQIPTAFMHEMWPAARMSWIKAVQSCKRPLDFVMALRVMEGCLKPVLFNPIWFDGLGHTSIWQFKKDAKDDDKDKEKEKDKDNGSGVVPGLPICRPVTFKKAPNDSHSNCDDTQSKAAGGASALQQQQQQRVQTSSEFRVTVKYSLGLKHTAFRLKGEEYRVFAGSGWQWMSSTRRPLASKTVQRAGADGVIETFAKHSKLTTAAAPSKLLEELNQLRLAASEVDVLLERRQAMEERGRAELKQLSSKLVDLEIEEKSLSAELEFVVERFKLTEEVESANAALCTVDETDDAEEMEGFVKIEATSLPENCDKGLVPKIETCDNFQTFLSEGNSALFSSSNKQPPLGASGESGLNLDNSQRMELKDRQAATASRLKGVREKMDALKNEISRLSPSTRAKTHLEIGASRERPVRARGSLRPDQMPPFCKFAAPSGRKSIFCLDVCSARVLRRKAGLWEVPNWRYEARPPSSVQWIYPAPRPSFGTCWRFRTSTSRTLAAVALQLRILWTCLRWDDMKERPPSSGKWSRSTEHEIVTREVLQHRYRDRFRRHTDYLVKRLIIPLSPFDDERDDDFEVYTPARSGLRQRRKKRADSPQMLRPRATEGWEPAESLDLWEIRLYHEKLHQAKGVGSTTMAPSTDIQSQRLIAATRGVRPVTVDASMSAVHQVRPTQGWPPSKTVSMPVSTPEQMRPVKAIYKDKVITIQASACDTPAKIRNLAELGIRVALPPPVHPNLGSPNSGVVPAQSPLIISANAPVTLTPGASLGLTAVRPPIRAPVAFQQQILPVRPISAVAGAPSAPTLAATSSKLQLPQQPQTGVMLSAPAVRSSLGMPTRLGSGPSKPQITSSAGGLNATSTTGTGHLSVVERADGKLELHGLQPNQQLRCTPDGKMQLITKVAHAPATDMQSPPHTPVRGEQRSNGFASVQSHKQHMYSGSTATPNVGMSSLSERMSREDLNEVLIAALNETDDQAVAERIMAAHGNLHVPVKKARGRTLKPWTMEAKQEQAKKRTERRLRRLVDARMEELRQAMVHRRSVLERELADELRLELKQQRRREQLQNRYRQKQLLKKMHQQRQQEKQLDKEAANAAPIVPSPSPAKKRKLVPSNIDKPIALGGSEKLKSPLGASSGVGKKVSPSNQKNASKSPEPSKKLQKKKTSLDLHTTKISIPGRAGGNVHIGTSQRLTKPTGHVGRPRKNPVGPTSNFATASPSAKITASTVGATDDTASSGPTTKNTSQLYCICKTPYDEFKFYIGCDLCNNWFHGSCVGVTEKRARSINSWVCDDCKRQQASVEQQLYCICRTPYDEHRFYIGCDSCFDWFHGQCVGVSEHDADKIDKWVCERCRSRRKGTKGSQGSATETCISGNGPSSAAATGTPEKRLGESEYETLLALVKDLRAHKMAWPFLNPVNAADVPDYYRTIKHPMDLTSVLDKLTKRQYRYFSEFNLDMSRIFDNCRQYNAPETTFFKCANVLETFYCKRLVPIKKKFAES